MYKPEPDAADVLFKEMSFKLRKQFELAVYTICQDICTKGENTLYPEAYDILWDHIEENSDYYIAEPDLETSP